jgi:protein gp37
MISVLPGYVASLANGFKFSKGGNDMAANVAGDVLTGDWNPLIGCEKYSVGCKNCWFLDFMFPWQLRLGNIPVGVDPHSSYVFPKRMSVTDLKSKKGIIGVVQHGDLFWEKVATSNILKVLDIIDNTIYTKENTIPKYVLWTKRIERAASILNGKYPNGLPSYLAIACSIEDQATADKRLPHLVTVKGTKIIVAEPIVGPISISKWVNDVQWVIVGSETTDKKTKIPLITICNPNWVRQMRDETVKSTRLGREIFAKDEVPFFIKQLGTKHGIDRVLDGREWNEFPKGFVK